MHGFAPFLPIFPLWSKRRIRPISALNNTIVDSRLKVAAGEHDTTGDNA
jgi:hypothetical protein